MENDYFRRDFIPSMTLHKNRWLYGIEREMAHNDDNKALVGTSHPGFP